MISHINLFLTLVLSVANPEAGTEKVLSVTPTSSIVAADTSRSLRLFLVDEFPSFVPVGARWSPVVVIQRPAKFGGLVVYAIESEVSVDLLAVSLYTAARLKPLAAADTSMRLVPILGNNISKLSAGRRNVAAAILQKAKSQTKRRSPKHKTSYRHLKVNIVQ